MLTELHIQGLAIIDSLSIQFSCGFNVITGETGAGKSILIKALNLLLGGKSNSETVRRGKESATVAGTFEASSAHPCIKVLEKYSIPIEAAGNSICILVRRSISSKGRSLAWINDLPVTISVLKEFGSSLIDIFGQHENQRLLDPSTHIFYLDQFIEDKKVLDAYQECYAQTYEVLKSIKEMVELSRVRARDYDYISFRYDALREFSPDRTEYEEIVGLCKLSREKISIVKNLELAQSILEQGSNESSISSQIIEVARTLDKIQSIAPEAEPLAAEAKLIACRLDDLSFELGKTLAKLDLDESKLELAQQRLAGYQDFFRKLAVNGIDELILEQNRLKADIELAATVSNKLVDSLCELDCLADKLFSIADNLTQNRYHAKKVVCRLAESELRDLAMPGAKLEVEFSEVIRDFPHLDLSSFGPESAELWQKILKKLSGLGECGAEKAQFLLSTNIGEPLHALHKTASGGEISRIMLALKKVLTDGADTCILVFDEIDTGISGRVADIVGRKMRELSLNLQVICISHLPQVAAYADTHFLVHKLGIKDRTESTIARLTPQRSEEEIARLLSGAEVTASSLANARALLKKTQAVRSATHIQASSVSNLRLSCARKQKTIRLAKRKIS